MDLVVEVYNDIDNRVYPNHFFFLFSQRVLTYGCWEFVQGLLLRGLPSQTSGVTIGNLFKNKTDQQQVLYKTISRYYWKITEYNLYPETLANLVTFYLHCETH